MSTSLIFATGVLCFALTLVGVLLTVYEFKQLARANARASTSAAPLPPAVEPLRPRRRA